MNDATYEGYLQELAELVDGPVRLRAELAAIAHAREDDMRTASSAHRGTRTTWEGLERRTVQLQTSASLLATRSALPRSDEGATVALRLAGQADVEQVLRRAAVDLQNVESSWQWVERARRELGRRPAPGPAAPAVNKAPASPPAVLPVAGRSFRWWWVAAGLAVVGGASAAVAALAR